MRDVSGPVLSTQRETPDVASSSEAYARRFAGPAGAYLLDVQSQATLTLLRPWPEATVLDVGGGHAQLCVPLIENGYAVTVLGSEPSCFARPRALVSAQRVRCVTGDLVSLPFADRSFDVVTAFRMSAHVTRWRRMIAELCRVARRAVIIDFAARWSVNLFSPVMFHLKKRIEGNTRPFNTLSHRAVRDVFIGCGYDVSAVIPEFFLPMVLHRMLKRPGASRCVEAVCRGLGLTRLLGSPVILCGVRRCDGPAG
jgi:SAM-dependent methyltransferase